MNENLMSISVVINTYNASEHLEKVLESVKGFDEVVVCDMESTDDTVKIARRYGARVLTFPKGEHRCCEPARNYAISSAASEWVLVVDDDELVPRKLRQYLYHYTTKKNPAAGLYIPRRNYIMDRFRKATYPDYQLRFMQRDAADWPPHIHSVPEIDGPVGKIPSNRHELALIHMPPTLNTMLAKLNAYTTAENDVDDEQKEKVTLLKLMWAPTWKFINAYFLKGA